MADYEVTIIGIASSDGIRRLERAITVRKKDGGETARILSPRGPLDSTAELLLMARRMLREDLTGALQASVRNLPEMSAARIREGAQPMGNSLEVRLHLQRPGTRHINEEIRNQERLDEGDAAAAEREAGFSAGRGI